MQRPLIQQQVTFLFTPDLAATAAFYEDVLQLPLALDQGSCRIYTVCPNGFIGFCSGGAAQATAVNTAGVILTLVTEAVDDWYSYLRGRAIPVEKPPTLNETYNIYHLFVRDPNGYLIEIQRFNDPRWPSPR